MIGRLAGAMGKSGVGKKAIDLIKHGYETAVGRRVLDLGQDFGAGLLFGASPGEAGVSALASTGGAVLGARIGKRFGYEGIGEVIGGIGGGLGGFQASQMLIPAPQPVDTPTPASAGREAGQANLVGAYDRPLTEDDVRIQAQQAKLMQAQYALQQYNIPRQS